MRGEDELSHAGDAEAGGDAHVGEPGAAWAGLLAHAMHLVTAASVVPPEQDGVAWRASMPAIIGFQSVTMALGWMMQRREEIGEADVRVGLDRARVLIRRFERQIEDAWRGRALPAAIEELMRDAVAITAGVDALLNGGGRRE